MVIYIHDNAIVLSFGFNVGIPQPFTEIPFGYRMVVPVVAKRFVLHIELL